VHGRQISFPAEGGNAGLAPWLGLVTGQSRVNE
jgi:hypothetical protein